MGKSGKRAKGLQKRLSRLGWGAAVNRILPGDHTHHEHQIGGAGAAYDAIQAADDKRRRKARQRQP
jgi:hypothetical protein